MSERETQAEFRKCVMDESRRLPDFLTSLDAAWEGVEKWIASAEFDRKVVVEVSRDHCYVCVQQDGDKLAGRLHYDPKMLPSEITHALLEAHGVEVG